MSEDTRVFKQKRGRLVVANPGSGDSDDGKGTLNHPPTSRPPPTPATTTYTSSEKQTSSTNGASGKPSGSSTQLKMDLPSLPQLCQPASPVSTGSPTTPPTPPTMHALSSSLDLPKPESSPSASRRRELNHYSDRNYFDPTPPHSSGRSKFTNILKAPFGGRPPPNKSNPADIHRRPHRTVSSSRRVALLHANKPLTTVPYGKSPTVSTDAYQPLSPPIVSERVIFVTSDSERYVAVDISSAQTAGQIRGLILSKLDIRNDEENNPCKIYQNEIGSFAIGEPVTDERLFNLCRDHGDHKGSLKFLAVGPEQVPPSSEYPPRPAQLTNTIPLRTSKRDSRSRNGSISSQSEIFIPEIGEGYEADAEHPDRDALRPTTRSNASLSGSSSSQTPLPPSPRRRPSIPNGNSSSAQPPPTSPLPLVPDQRSGMVPRKDEKYGHALPAIPIVMSSNVNGAPPLSPHRPTFSFPDEPSSPGTSLSVPRERHIRSGSDAAAERDSALRASEKRSDTLNRQLRTENHQPSMHQLRTEYYRDNSTGYSTLNDDMGQEIIIPSGRPQDDPDRISPLTRRRPQPTSSYRPRSPYNMTRTQILANPPRHPPPPPPSSSLTPLQPIAQSPSQSPSQSQPQEGSIPQPGRKPRAAHQPINPKAIISWKGEEPRTGGKLQMGPPSSSSSNWQNSNRLAMNATRSMDNLRQLGSPSRPRNQHPPQVPNRPGTSGSPSMSNNSGNYSSGPSLTFSGPKSYDSTRGYRPLPPKGILHVSNSGSTNTYTGTSALDIGSGPYTRNFSSSTLALSPSSERDREPFPRPQSATGTSPSSPTRGYQSHSSHALHPYPHAGQSYPYSSAIHTHGHLQSSSPGRLTSPTYLDTGDSSRSPRTVSPNTRMNHLPGAIPGPRPKPSLPSLPSSASLSTQLRHHAPQQTRQNSQQSFQRRHQHQASGGQSDQSHSGPETSTTSPPRTPNSPLYTDKDARYIHDERDPYSLQEKEDESPPTSPGEVPTLRPEDKKVYEGLLQNRETASRNSPPPNSSTNAYGDTFRNKEQERDSSPTKDLQTNSFQNYYNSQNLGEKEYDSDSSSEAGGNDGTWIVPFRNQARPRLEVRTADINGTSNGTGPDVNGTMAQGQEARTMDSNSTKMEVTVIPPPESTSDGDHMSPRGANIATTGGLSIGTTAGLRINKRPESTFTDPEGDNWTRPPPENIYKNLEKFFSEHDLDRPVIEASSGDTSPVAAEPVPPLPISNSSSMEGHDNDERENTLMQGQARISRNNHIRAKKSIRIVAQEHKKKIDRMSRAADTMVRVGSNGVSGSDMIRKRSTKLWGSRLEEVTPASLRSVNPAPTIPESPTSTGGPTTFKWMRGEVIGRGTYGKVYLALNATTGEMIAVKQVEMPQSASDRQDSRQHTVVQALKSESETLRHLDHPHIVQYLGFEETPANLSIFLEYVPGGSVGSCLYKHGKFADNVTRSFTAQILSGLEYLHSKGILHRDLKADNILVEMTGTCKISDFGISKRTEDMAGDAFTAMQGTVFWMAPEVIKSQKKGYNNKIDIWSVGCVVLEMWQGGRPWTGEEMVAVMFKLYQAKQPPPVPDDVILSEEADDLRRQCFAINPEERPSAAELRRHPYLILPPDWTFTGFT